MMPLTRASTAMSLQIRDARPNDQTAIRQVTLAAYEEYAAQLPAHWAGYRQNILATLADVTRAQQIVAEQDGVLLGTVLLFPSEATEMPWPEVRLLAVVPGARGRGIGAALMQECVRRTRASGTNMLTLHTTDMMQTALRLYTRMGFLRAPGLDFHPAPGLTIKGYRLDLEGPARQNVAP